MTFSSVLFLCVGNRARSQLSEALARDLFGDAVRVQSAGSAPSEVHPLVPEVLAEVGVSAEGLHSKHVDTIDPASVDLVITLCAEESCPLFLSDAPRLAWPLPDPDGAEDTLTVFRRTRDQIAGRLQLLAALRDGPTPLSPSEFHASVRVPDLPVAVRFYAWLLGQPPAPFTHRWAAFVVPSLNLNFVVLADDGHDLHHDTLYHLGVGLPDKAAVVDAHHRAVAAGWPVHKPARTTWRGTPLHELWLTDPGGNLVELYARLTDAELAERPDDLEPTLLVEA